MKIFNTATLDEKTLAALSPDEASWIYNGLDCCVTAEVYEALRGQLAEEEECVQLTHDFARRKLAMFMDMSLRGIAVDETALRSAVADLERKRNALERTFHRLTEAAGSGKINFKSPTQLKQFFYHHLGIKAIKARNSRGLYAETVNDEALEKIKSYVWARPFAVCVQHLRSYQKSIGFLSTQRDEDGRFRTTYNVAGTNTGRLNSAESEFQTGTNLQNVDRSLRTGFIADPGMYFVNIDLEQGDSRNVGAIGYNMFYDATEEQITKLLRQRGLLKEHQSWKGPVGEEFARSYLDACESGDLHTTVCRMAWPHLDWPEDPSLHKKFCDGIILYGQDSYRQGSKKLGHGTNYYGQPRTMARHTHTPVPIIQGFQNAYFRAFPVVPAWQQQTINLISETGTLYNLFGRRRMFYGRGNDATTHRAGIAFAPQSSTGEEIDRGIYQVWSRFDPKIVQLLVQVHDSVMLQVPFEAAEELVPQILDAMRVSITLRGGREFSVALDAKCGWNWGDFDAKRNPHGLKGWSGSESRTRPSPTKRLKDYL